jgi:chaperone required for assembly of F1-ATPase
MSAWAAKRFWKSASVVQVEQGFTVHLDARPVKTPSKKLLILPTAKMAQAVALEWDAQFGLIRPDLMPMTRYANSAIEKVAPQFDAVADHLATYGETDLLCYRAVSPQELIDRQAAAWDIWLDWSARDLAAPLHTVAGIVFAPQPAPSLSNLRAQMTEMSPCHLSAFHDLVAISGSLILALAMAKGQINADEGYALSRIDEQWQIEQWGQDEEASALDASKQRAMQDAWAFFQMST